ncbi:MAG: DUF11 domain-containing protein, partial [Chloroflexi bacterium]|nr:DUF11 domain-containing protein [Chloroflexota bacterium]
MIIIRVQLIDDALAVFSRNSSTGALTFVEVVKDSDSGIDGLNNVRDLALSPNGDHLYVGANGDDSVAVFSVEGGAEEFVQTPSESVGLNEAVLAALGFSRSDTMTLNEAILAALGFSRSDAIALVDTVVLLRLKAVSDSASIGESVASALGISRSDSASLADSIQSALGKGIADAASLVESVVLGFPRGDSASLGESVASSLGKLVSDTASLVETVANALGLSPADSASIGETAASALGFSRTDSASLGDTVTSAFNKSASDATSLGESVANALGLSPGDSANLTDATTNALGTQSADSSSIVDLVATALGMSPSGVVNLSDTLQNALGKRESDVASLGESVATALGFTPGGAVNLSDTINQILGKGISDVSVLGESAAMALGLGLGGSISLLDTINTNVILGTTDLIVTITDSPDPVLARNNLVYTVLIVNNGPGNATGVTMTDTLPDGVIFVSASANNGSNCNLTGSALTCNIGSISNGDSVKVSIIVAPTAAGIVDTSIDIVNSGVVTFNEFESDPSNNTATVSTTVIQAADLVVTKTGSPDPIQVGDTLTYTVTVANNGPSTATGVVLTDTLPPNMTVGSVVSTQGSCAEVSGIVTCNLGDLDDGVSA